MREFLETVAGVADPAYRIAKAGIACFGLSGLLWKLLRKLPFWPTDRRKKEPTA